METAYGRTISGHDARRLRPLRLHQDLQALLRCHMQAFAAIGGVPSEILYDRMKTSVTGEDGDRHIVYIRSPLGLARHLHPVLASAFVISD